MKRKIFFILFLFSYMLGFAVMPTYENPDYSQWNWEDQSQANWRMKIGNNWVDVNPAFGPYTDRTGLITEVYKNQDYTKAKGWQLVWAQFNNEGYPYFMLYNPHKSTLRVFFYLGGSESFSHILATLGFHDVNNPGVLSMGTEFQNATDHYHNNFTDDDVLAEIIPNTGIQSWCAADFLILYDNNIRSSKYREKMWFFAFYGCDNYDINIKGKSSSDPENIDLKKNQYSVSSSKGAINGTKFYGEYAKLHKNIQSIDKLLKEMQSSAKSIDTTSAKTPQFIKNYKKGVENFKGASDIVSAASSFSSAISAILGFLNIVSGSFSENQSAPPKAVIQYTQLIGTMDVKKVLKANTISISGVDGNYYPQGLTWEPFNCPMGTINVQKVPTIKKTSPYYRVIKYQLPSGLHPMPIRQTKANDATKYEADPYKFRKYRIDEDIILTEQTIPGLVREEVKFALVCKPTQEGKQKYTIDQQYICHQKVYYGSTGQLLSEGYILNPVYTRLSEGKFVVHKYDVTNNEIYFGTPYIPMNRFKGTVIEVPEGTEVKLGVMVKFKSDKYEEPVIFKAVYNMNETEIKVNEGFFEGNDVMESYFGDYEYDEGWKSFTVSKQHSDLLNLYGPLNLWGYPDIEGDEIRIVPGFEYKGQSGKTLRITATSKVGSGNTKINNINFNCFSTSLRSARIPFLEEEIEQEAVFEPLVLADPNTIEPLVFPNPTNGRITIQSADNKTPLQSLTLYNTSGMELLNNNTNGECTKEMDLSLYPPQMYILKIQTSDQIFTKKIILQK